MRRFKQFRMENIETYDKAMKVQSRLFKVPKIRNFDASW